MINCLRIMKVCGIYSYVYEKKICLYFIGERFGTQIAAKLIIMLFIQRYIKTYFLSAEMVFLSCIQLNKYITTKRNKCVLFSLYE